MAISYGTGMERRVQSQRVLECQGWGGVGVKQRGRLLLSCPAGVASENIWLATL